MHPLSLYWEFKTKALYMMLVSLSAKYEIYFAFVNAILKLAVHTYYYKFFIFILFYSYEADWQKWRNDLLNKRKALVQTKLDELRKKVPPTNQPPPNMQHPPNMQYPPNMHPLPNLSQPPPLITDRSNEVSELILIQMFFYY